MRSSGFKLLKIGYCLVSGYIFMKYLRIKPMPLIWFIILHFTREM